MKYRFISVGLKAVVFLVGAAAALVAQAQPYPNKPIRVIIPFSPGGPMELATRPMTTKLSESIGKPLLLEYKAGASAVIGTDYVAKAPADGYTLVMISSAQLSTPATLKSLPYDMVKDFAAISNVARSGLVLVAGPSLKVDTVADLIAYAKAQNRPMSFGSSGVGGAVHLASESLFLALNLPSLHVPFKGVGPALQEVIAGRIDVMFGGVSGVAPFAKTGKLKLLGFGGSTRAKTLPNVPTIAEASRVLEKFSVDSSYGILAPLGTPAPIVARLNAEVKLALATAEVEKAYTALDIEPWWSTPEQAAAWVKEEIEKWIAVTKAINYQKE